MFILSNNNALQYHVPFQVILIFTHLKVNNCYLLISRLVKELKSKFIIPLLKINSLINSEVEIFSLIEIYFSNLE